MLEKARKPESPRERNSKRESGGGRVFLGHQELLETMSGKFAIFGFHAEKAARFILSFHGCWKSFEQEL